MHQISTVVHADPEILGGTPVFIGTRVPVRILLPRAIAWTSFSTRSLPSAASRWWRFWGLPKTS